MRRMRTCGVLRVLLMGAALWTTVPAASAEKESNQMPFSQRLSGYFVERGRDFLDMFTLHGGLGLVLSADVEATILAHLGLAGGLSGIYRVEDLSSATEMDWGFPLSNWLMPKGILDRRTKTWRGHLITHVIVAGERDHDKQHYCALIPLLFTIREDGTFGPPSRKESPPIDWADVSAGGIVFPLAFRVGVRPGEMLDFLAGWFGFDLPGADAVRHGRGQR